jgi:hypothetical protein
LSPTHIHTKPGSKVLSQVNFSANHAQECELTLLAFIIRTAEPSSSASGRENHLASVRRTIPPQYRSHHPYRQQQQPRIFHSPPLASGSGQMAYDHPTSASPPTSYNALNSPTDINTIMAHPAAQNFSDRRLQSLRIEGHALSNLPRPALPQLPLNIRPSFPPPGLPRPPLYISHSHRPVSALHSHPRSRGRNPLLTGPTSSIPSSTVLRIQAPEFFPAAAAPTPHTHSAISIPSQQSTEAERTPPAASQATHEMMAQDVIYSTPTPP